MTPRIDAPRGSIIINEATLKAEIVWNPNYQAKWHAAYSNAQKFVDAEVVRLCEPYIPLRTGMLIKSGLLATDVGSGTVQWIAPYARAQYYSAREPGSETGRHRGPYWFERMKAAHWDQINSGARAIIKRESAK
jgi:hypothetical protein